MLNLAAFDVSATYEPMSGIDECLVHNGTLPARATMGSDPRAFERVWFQLRRQYR
jgi:hypothetical protein